MTTETDPVLEFKPVLNELHHGYVEDVVYHAKEYLENVDDHAKAYSENVEYHAKHKFHAFMLNVQIKRNRKKINKFLQHLIAGQIEETSFEHIMRACRMENDFTSMGIRLHKNNVEPEGLIFSRYAPICRAIYNENLHLALGHCINVFDTAHLRGNNGSSELPNFNYFDVLVDENLEDDMNVTGCVPRGLALMGKCARCHGHVRV